MSEQNNDHAVSTTQAPRPRYTGERLLRERPKIYRQVVRLLGEGWSSNKICKWCHVTRETVRAVETGRQTALSSSRNAVSLSIAALGDRRNKPACQLAGFSGKLPHCGKKYAPDWRLMRKRSISRVA